MPLPINIRALVSAVVCTLLVTTLLRTGISHAGTIVLPPIDHPLPYGAQAIELPPQEVRNDTNLRTVELLGAELLSDAVSRERKCELISDLACTKLPAAWAPLGHAANDKDPLVREAVADALAAFAIANPTAANHAIVATLSLDSDAKVRVKAISIAGSIKDRTVVRKALSDADSNVVAAALAVATNDDAAEVVRFISNTDSQLRIAAIEVSGREKMIAAADAIATQLGSDLPTRLAAVRALAALGASQHATQVLQLLSDVHPSVRRAATDALPSLVTQSDAQNQAIRMLADEDETVRTAATNVLVSAPCKNAVAPLVQQLANRYRPLHDAALKALVAAKGESISAAVALLNDADPMRRRDGSYLLGTLRSGDGLARHKQLVEDEDWQVAAQAIESLAIVAAPGTHDEISRSFDRVISEVRGHPAENSPQALAARNAIIAAVALHEPSIIARAVPLIADRTTYPAEVRAAAVWAIGVEAQSNPQQALEQCASRIDDVLETTAVKLEAIKSIGNLKIASGKAALERAAAQLPDRQAQALIHWSIDRLNGNVTTYNEPPTSYRAETTIEAISDK